MKTRAPYPPFRRASQRGVALLVALILLIVITLVGLAAIGTTLLQNKMASNQYDRQVAFQSAEAALRVAAAQLQADPTMVTRDCSGGTTTICSGNPFKDGVPSSDVYTVPKSTGGGTNTAFDPGSLAAGQPQYVIEFMGTQTQAFGAQSANCQQANSQLTCGSTNFKMYRITARSADPATARSRAVVTLQAVMKMG